MLTEIACASEFKLCFNDRDRAMKILSKTHEQDMLDHWRACEGIPADTPVRHDIFHDRFPRETTWHVAEIEAEDIDNLFMISVHDFGPISRQTWRVSVAAQNYLDGFTDNDHILRIRKLLDRDHFDPRVIAVSHAANGPYTILDGNHRAIILHSRGELIEKTCFLGLHAGIRHFDHAGMAYRDLRA